MSVTTLTLPSDLPIPLTTIWEIARGAERSHADFRVGAVQDMRGPSKSAAARRNAHLTDLALFIPALLGGEPDGGVWSWLWDNLHAGTLVEAVGGTRDSRVPQECYICSKRTICIVAKRHPRDKQVFPICLNELGCIPITDR